MITAIVQARLSSTRLPGKVLESFSGDTLLGHIISRVWKSKCITDLIVATTTNPADDPLVNWMEGRGIKYFRGSETDVLNRYFEAAKVSTATHVARITSDDPFKDPVVIDAVAEMYFRDQLDFAYNNKPPTFAEGLDTEIFSMKALARANSEATDAFEREHVTQHFYRNPDHFRQQNLSSPEDFSHLRWTIDTESDLLMAKTVYNQLYRPDRIFLTADILALIEAHPEIPKLNQHVNRSDMYKKP